MIVTFFDSGISKADGAIKYLLGSKNADGKDREPLPELISGCPILTKHLINTNTNKHKYTSGVIAFRKNEFPTDQQLDDIWNRFMMVMAPGMTEDNIHSFRVKHTHGHFLRAIMLYSLGKLKVDSESMKTLMDSRYFIEIQNCSLVEAIKENDILNFKLTWNLNHSLKDIK